MNYPIFSAIVNQIESRLAGRSIQVEQFRVWSEDKINATGLEIGIDLSDRSNVVNKLVINLDWDKFREIRLAKQLPGMEKHPFLKNGPFSSGKINPYVDVETTWHFDEQVLYRRLDSRIGNRRTEAASQWMEHINKELKRVFTRDNIITRWHMEVGGDIHGRFVTDMSLISYMQYDLHAFDTLNEIHSHLEQNIQLILQRTDTIIDIASKTMEQAA